MLALSRQGVAHAGLIHAAFSLDFTTLSMNSIAVAVGELERKREREREREREKEREIDRQR
jgi:hypothetical protein